MLPTEAWLLFRPMTSFTWCPRTSPNSNPVEGRVLVLRQRYPTGWAQVAGPATARGDGVGVSLGRLSWLNLCASAPLAPSITPAMESKLADPVWSVDELLSRLDSN